jgi:hypothetical protein
VKDTINYCSFDNGVKKKEQTINDEKNSDTLCMTYSKRLVIALLGLSNLQARNK